MLPSPLRLLPSGSRSRQYCRALADRSEEHTSELQSRSDLVCRLLLEKKKWHERSSSVREHCSCSSACVGCDGVPAAGHQIAGCHHYRDRETGCDVDTVQNPVSSEQK